MANLNKVMLMGNLTRDPELTYTPAQTAVANFCLAVNRTWTGQDGAKKEEVTFVDCTAFGRIAEIVTKYKGRGDPLFAEGRLKLDTWEAQDGTRRSKMRVVVENIQFLNRSPGAENREQYRGEETRPEPRRPAGKPQPGRPVSQAAAPPAHNPDPGEYATPGDPPQEDADLPF
jgi:single-strand DNA-binding protein